MARTKKSATPPAQAVDVFEQPVPASQRQEPAASNHTHVIPVPAAESAATAHVHPPGAILPPPDPLAHPQAPHNVENVTGLGDALAKMVNPPLPSPPSTVESNPPPLQPEPSDEEEDEDEDEEEPDDEEEDEEEEDDDDITPPRPKRYRCKEACRFMNRKWEVGDYLPPSATPRMIPSYFEEVPV